MHKRVGILYICTGKYNYFFRDFYSSSEKYFLPECEKTYFVFSDDEKLTDASNVKIIKKECLGFPLDSLFHFDFFLQQKTELEGCEYIFYFNSNIQFLKEVGENFLPTAEDGYLIGEEWPAWIGTNPMYFPYERRKQSLAYIEPRKPPYHYFMGGIIGGRSKEFLQMSEVLAKNIQNDYERGIIARFHDESHVNRYFRDHKCKILPPEFSMPEEWITNQTVFSKLRDKAKLSNSFDVEKGRSKSFTKRVLNYLNKQIIALKWYL